jgi:hypothetical protein
MNNDLKIKEDQKIVFMKILIPLVVVWGVIQIAQAGFVTGNWLYQLLH